MRSYSWPRQVIITILYLLASSAVAAPNSGVPDMVEENGYVEPFQILGNVFYVGDKWVSSYVIETTSGLVLIDTLDWPYSKWIPTSIEKLGLDPADIKYIFITHGHSDHVAGAHYLQSKYGSQIVMTSADYKLAEKQSKESRGKGKFPAPSLEIIAKDDTTLKVGNTEFQLYITPGHTEGCLSLDFFIDSESTRYRAFVVGGNGANFEGLSLARQYLDSARRIRDYSRKEPRVQVNLANHPNMNQLFERRDRALSIHSNNPYIDPIGFQKFVDVLESRGKEKLIEEQKKILNN